jgi:hypothetical protein
MPTRASFNLADHENEKASVILWVQDMSALNYAGVTASIDSIKEAIETISLGTVNDTGFAKSFPEDVGYPSDVPAAQREAKWLVTYQDTMQYLDTLATIANPGYLKVFNAEIPCADLSLLPDGKEELDLEDGGVVAAFVADFQANVRSPYNHSNAVTPSPAEAVKVLSIKHIGKST